MFDLPVIERAERKAAAKFRHFLLDQGFQMTPYSIYTRLLGGHDKVSALERRIASRVPSEGSVYVMTITDKQYENIKTFQGGRRGSPKNPDQLQLF